MRKIGKLGRRITPQFLKRFLFWLVGKKRDLGVRLRDFSARSNSLAALYYFCFSRDFAHEQRTVLEGLRQYRKKVANKALLRRNVHRLEKGMIMRPRKERFALDYIGGTVTAFVEDLKECQSSPPDDVLWFHDVLKNYFAVSGSCSVVDRARERFDAAVQNVEFQSEENRIPYSREDSVVVDVKYEALLDLSRRRCSVRWFEPRDVPMDLIKKALLVGLQSPSACNRQPFRFHFVTDRSRVESVASLAWGTAGFSDNIPAVGVVIGTLDDFFSERDRHLPYIDSALAIGPFLLALETLGLGSCCLNWPDLKGVDAQMAKRIELKDYERVIMLIAIGYPDPEGGVPYSQKKGTGDLCVFNELLPTGDSSSS